MPRLFLACAKRGGCAHFAAPTEQKLRVWWYIVHAALEDPSAREAGFVLLANGRDAQLRDFCPTFAVGVCTSINMFPIQWRAAHICCCDTALYGMISSGIRAAMSLEQRETLHVHGCSGESLVKNLSLHSFQKGCIPKDLGENSFALVRT